MFSIFDPGRLVSVGLGGQESEPLGQVMGHDSPSGGGTTSDRWMMAYRVI